MLDVLEQLFYVPHEKLALLTTSARSWGIDAMHFDAVTGLLVALAFAGVSLVCGKRVIQSSVNRTAFAVIGLLACVCAVAHGVRTVAGSSLPLSVDMAIEGGITISVSLTAGVFIYLAKSGNVHLR
jgi:multidrug transporter EmrE-like cation transporter